MDESRILELVQPLGGLISRIDQYRAELGESTLSIRIARVGDVSQLWQDDRKSGKSAIINGVGVAADGHGATIIAIAEAIERYSASSYDGRELIFAAANDLGNALALGSVPRCSPVELAQPRCPLREPELNKPIHWVRGISLVEGREVLIPGVMVYMHPRFVTPAERFWLPITTGCAAGPTYAEAVLAALLEVIERDAISLLWLQKLPLPVIEIDTEDVLREYRDTYYNSSRHLEHIFFDATTDLGVPIIYGVQISHTVPHMRTIVSCSAAQSGGRALMKVCHELASLRNVLRSRRAPPADFDNFTDGLHGATYMARAENAIGFSFLLDRSDERPISKLSQMPSLGRDPVHSLELLVGRLTGLGMEAYAVDLTTDEAVRAGLVVVRVVVPALQPLSFHYRARFLGHPRLYDAPKKMGYRGVPEAEVNAWPQPFA
jgi:ribosomal protein S12 methylthiotransferase accessory factor